jgi:hypothetical protein
VAWFGEEGTIRLAHLDQAMSIVDTTDVSISASLPHNLRLTAEESDRIHLTWADSFDGQPTLVYAIVAVRQETPLTYQPIPLADDARHVEALLNLEEQRLDVFWSDLSTSSEGLFHQAFSLTGEELTARAHVTEDGWKPGAAWDTNGQIHLAWTGEGVDGHTAVWYAQFDPASQSTQGSRILAEEPLRRGSVLEGPEVSTMGGTGVVGWSIGDHRQVLVGSGDVASGNIQTGGRPGFLGNPAEMIDGDRAYYALVGSETTQPSQARSLVVDPCVGAYGRPSLYSAEGEAWAVYSCWVARRSMVRRQILVLLLTEEMDQEPTPVSQTQRRSLFPDLDGEGGTQRAVWLEPISTEISQVVVASNGSEARAALGGFLWAEWFQDIAMLGMDMVGMVIFLPMALVWTVLPLGIVLLASRLGSGESSGWRAALWLGGALVLQLIMKGLVAGRLSPFQTDLVQAALALIPFALGGGAMWLYWRRADSPSLIPAYGLFALIDVACSLFILLPLELWGI